MKKVSVIVPAYNCHDTLARCLGSLVNQSLEDIEIVVVNDASTDDTWEIMKRCKEQFPEKVEIINGVSNRGVGGARNQGLDAATGEYIGFVDGDDYVSAEMYEKLYNTAVETDSDIVDSGIYFEATDRAVLNVGDNCIGTLNDEKRRILVLGGGYITSKLFKRSLFYEPRFRIRENVRSLEDNDLIKYMYFRAKKIWNIKEVFYIYCNNQNSATKDMNLESYYQSVYGVIGGIYDKCHGFPEYDSIKDAMEYTILQFYSYGLNRCLYDQINRYGADVKNVANYFEGLSNELTDMLKRLVMEKNMVITIPYRDNKEVIKRISEIDIKIMEECDRRYT